MPKKFIKPISLLLCFCFFFTQTGLAQLLPQPLLVPLQLPVLRYLSVNTANPSNYFNFLLDRGQRTEDGGQRIELNQEAKKLIHYFFLGLTLPSEAFWVNLKPQEPERITSDELSKTDLGRTLLEQDLKLKKDMANYLHPKHPQGKLYWERLYAAIGKDKAKKVTITSSSRVWIVPAEAVVLETEDGALVAKATLKVLLESEYLSLRTKGLKNLKTEKLKNEEEQIRIISENLMKEIILPALTKDINESPGYAPLRQVYHSLILAEWYKRKHRDASLRGATATKQSQDTNNPYSKYINSGTTTGLESALPWEKQAIWQEYLKSYQEGEYKLQDTIFGLKRMYFSGGILLGMGSSPITILPPGSSSPAAAMRGDVLTSLTTSADKILPEKIEIITVGEKEPKEPNLPDTNSISKPIQEPGASKTEIAGSSLQKDESASTPSISDRAKGIDSSTNKQDKEINESGESMPLSLLRKFIFAQLIFSLLSLSTHDPASDLYYHAIGGNISSVDQLVDLSMQKMDRKEAYKAATYLKKINIDGIVDQELRLAANKGLTKAAYGGSEVAMNALLDVAPEPFDGFPDIIKDFYPGIFKVDPNKFEMRTIARLAAFHHPRALGIIIDKASKGDKSAIAELTNIALQGNLLENRLKALKTLINLYSSGNKYVLNAFPDLFMPLLDINPALLDALFNKALSATDGRTALDHEKNVAGILESLPKDKILKYLNILFATETVLGEQLRVPLREKINRDMNKIIAQYSKKIFVAQNNEDIFLLIMTARFEDSFHEKLAIVQQFRDKVKLEINWQSFNDESHGYLKKDIAVFLALERFLNNDRSVFKKFIEMAGTQFNAKDVSGIENTRKRLNEITPGSGDSFLIHLGLNIVSQAFGVGLPLNGYTLSLTEVPKASENTIEQIIDIGISWRKANVNRDVKGMYEMVSNFILDRSMAFIASHRATLEKQLGKQHFGLLMHKLEKYDFSLSEKESFITKILKSIRQGNLRYLLYKLKTNILPNGDKGISLRNKDYTINANLNYKLEGAYNIEEIRNAKDNKLIVNIIRGNPKQGASLEFGADVGRATGGISAKNLQAKIGEKGRLVFDAPISFTTGKAKPTELVIEDGAVKNYLVSTKGKDGMVIIYSDKTVHIADKQNLWMHDIKPNISSQQDRRLDIIHNAYDYVTFIQLARHEKISLVCNMLLYDGKQQYLLNDDDDQRRLFVIFDDGTFGIVNSVDRISTDDAVKLARVAGAKQVVYMDTGQFDYATVHFQDGSSEVWGHSDQKESSNRIGLYFNKAFDKTSNESSSPLLEIKSASSAIQDASSAVAQGPQGLVAHEIASPAIESGRARNDNINNGGIDLSSIELTLKDDKYISSLNPADIKILRAAKALKEEWNSLSLLYIHELILLLKDNLASEIQNKNLLSQVLRQLQSQKFLDPQAIQFLNFIQANKPLSEVKLAMYQ